MSRLFVLLLFLPWVISGQQPAPCPMWQHCPSMAQIFSDTTANDALFWNGAQFWNPVGASTDLPERALDLGIHLLDTCATAALHDVSFVLYLDLDGDGQRESAVSSDNLPPSGFLWTHNTGGNEGKLTAFDHRSVPPGSIFRFALQTGISNQVLTARLRWTTSNQPTVGVLPLLPEGTHRMVWYLGAIGGPDSCGLTFTIRDGKAPKITCRPSHTVSLPANCQSALAVDDLLQVAEDNLSPFSQLSFGISRFVDKSGYTFQHDSAFSAQFILQAKDIGNHRMALWARDLSGNEAYCLSVVAVEAPPGGCKLQAPICPGKTTSGDHFDINRDLHPVFFDVPDRLLQASETADVPVFLSGKGAWSGFQADFVFDESLVQLQLVKKGQAWEHFPFQLIQKPGRLSVIWPHGMEVIPMSDRPLLIVSIKALQTAHLRQAVALADKPVSPQAFAPDGNVLPLSLEFSSHAGQQAPVTIYPPFPNPTSSGVDFCLHLTQNLPVQVELTDLWGRLLCHRQFQLEAGPARFELPAEVFPKSGLYGWRVQAGEYTASGKLFKS